MKLHKVLGAIAAASAMVCGSASAVTVAGVTWNPDSFFDLQANANLFELPVLVAGEELTGYGIVSALNQLGDSSFCPGCELTFTFSGYTLNNDIVAPGGAFSFSGGSFTFYADATPNATPGDVSTYNDGVLWLTLAGADPLGLGGTLNGAATIPTTGGIAGQGTGYLNVVLNGSAAEEYFDTNGQIGGTDFSYTSSFQPLTNGVLGDGNTHFGTANIAGNSRAVPEPGALALLGLGLAGLGFTRRNKKSA